MRNHQTFIYSAIEDSTSTLTPNDPVCLDCYEAHTSLSLNAISTDDTDLQVISLAIKGMAISDEKLSGFKRHIAKALIYTCQHLCIESSAILL